MRRPAHRVLFVTAVTVLAAGTAAAQTSAPGTRTPEQIRASYDAHKGDFDYLLGDWEFTSVSREHGAARGFWSAARMEGGHVLDEYRIVGDGGETWYHLVTLRTFNGALDQWELVSAEQGSGLRDVGTGRRVGAEMHLEQTFGAGTPTPSVWRIRYYDIRPDRFSWTADRSTDGGRSWTTGHLRIEARRIGPARTLASLAPARAGTRRGGTR